MEEEKTRREVQVKHALRAERDSRDDRKRNRDATSVYTHIYITAHVPLPFSAAFLIIIRSRFQF